MTAFFMIGMNCSDWGAEISAGVTHLFFSNCRQIEFRLKDLKPYSGFFMYLSFYCLSSHFQYAFLRQRKHAVDCLENWKKNYSDTHYAIHQTVYKNTS